MKCPKCGYNSFETYDTCRKCATDLTEFKQTHGIVPLVLPAEVRKRMAAELGGGATTAEAAASENNNNDMFSFDLPQHEEPATPPPAADPFAFDTPATAAPAAPAFSFDTPAATPTHDPFADLLESTPQAPKAAAAPAAAPTAGDAGQGFELNSFSWDDTPEPPSAGAAPQATPEKKVDDDFSSLFGDLGTPEKK